MLPERASRIWSSVGDGVGVEQRLRAHHEAGRAEAALAAVHGQERGLDGVEVVDAAEALDGLDGAVAHLQREELAGVDGSAVEQDGAGAALAAVAAALGAGEVELVAQGAQERPAMVDLQLAGLAVDVEGDAGAWHGVVGLGVGC